jgi:hypothetical protein
MQADARFDLRHGRIAAAPRWCTGDEGTISVRGGENGFGRCADEHVERIIDAGNSGGGPMKLSAVLRRAAFVACISATSACSGIYSGSNYVPRTTVAGLQCPTDAVAVCEQTQRGKECGCAQQSLIWRR